MSDLKNRIKQLESQTGADKPDKKTMVLIGPPSEETIAEAIAEAIRLGILPEQIGGGDPTEGYNVIWVIDAETKELTERIIAGEGTE